MKFQKNIFIFVCLIVSLAIYYFIVHNHGHDQGVDNSLIRRIAIFQPATHPALDEIAQGFIDTMNDQASLDYVFDRYNANGNKILMQAQAQEMLQKKYDLIFTIGVGCSVTVKDLSFKKHNQTPIVFTAVDNPGKLDLQGLNITGVIDQSNYQQQLDLLLKIKPTTQKILLVYDQSQASGLEKDKHEIALILQDKNISLVSVEILNIGEIAQKVTGFIDSVDVVMVLKDNTIVSGIDSIISLCQRYHVTLLASDLNSGEKGAALAYGIYERDSGVCAAHQAKLIIQEGKIPGQVPVVAVKNMVMSINCKHAQLQGLDIDKENVSIPGVQIDCKG